MKTEQFKAWRKKMGFTQQQAADALGVYARTITNYERGQRYEDGREVKIPESIALACSALYAHLEPWDDLT